MYKVTRPLLTWCVLLSSALACARDAADPTGPAESAVESAPPGTNDEFVSVFVHYKANAPQARLETARGRGARFAYDLEGSRWLALEMPRHAVHALDNMPWVEEVQVTEGAAHLADDVYPWGIDSSGGRAVHAYAQGNGVKIAFLDGGTRCTYPDLTTRVVGGYDFVAGNSTFCQNTMSSTRSLEHGTYVAQVLGASINLVKYVGMAPEAKLYNLRVCESVPTPSDGGSCSYAKIAAALDWARVNGMQVVSASIADCGSSPLGVWPAIDALYAANIVQVWAGGNGTDAGCSTGGVSGFLVRPGTLAVTSYSAVTGYVPTFSHHSSLDIAAPTGVQAQSIYGGNDCCFGGTSASAPHVAGAAALMIGLGFSGVDLITQRLLTTAEDRGTAGYDIYYGAGILRVDSAAKRKPSVTLVNGAPQPIQVAGIYPLSASISNGIAPIQVQWTVHYSNGVLPDVTTGYGANALNLDVPAGSYTITVRATPKEATYLRVGLGYQIDYPVCTEGGGGGGDLAAGIQTAGRPDGGGTGAGGGITPNGVGGCTQ